MSNSRTSDEWKTAAARRHNAAKRRAAPANPAENMMRDHLGAALRWLRLRRQLAQHKVADKAGIGRPMLSAYERGKVNPTLETLERILHALGCDLGQLHAALRLVSEEIAPPAGKVLLNSPASSAAATEEEQAFLRLKEAIFDWLEAVRESVLGSVGEPRDDGGRAAS